jgi:spore coat polysaccharide biosynthesis protein SpsF
MESSVTAIIQARMGSTRLPGKTLLPIFGEKTVIELLLERVAKAKSVGRVLVATSVAPQDNVLADFCENRGIACFRGHETDVLDRFYRAALSSGPADTLVRLTGDCPLHDPDVIDAVIRFCRTENLDYGSNVDPPTFPDGLDTEVFRFSTLEQAWKDAKQPEEREHVTIYMKRRLDLFRQKTYRNESDLSFHHWTLDDNDDLRFVRGIYQHLYPINPDFRMRDVLAFLEQNPDHRSIRDKWSHIIR